MGRRSKSRIESLVSAGGVVYRQGDGGIETVLCGRSLTSIASGDEEDPRERGGRFPPECFRWSLAKGTPDSGETLEQTALREVREETGLEVELEAPISSITYWFADRESSVKFRKTVHFYLMVPVGGDTGLHDPEFDVVQWFSFDEALGALAYPNEAGVLRQAGELISRQIGDL
jgi:ADP-ribose pyrophosphatase YjhB (NUDIX family)